MKECAISPQIDKTITANLPTSYPEAHRALKLYKFIPSKFKITQVSWGVLNWLGRWFFKITYSESITNIDKDIENIKSVLAVNDEQKAVC